MADETFLEKTIKAISKIKEEEIRGKLARALRDSVYWEKDDHPGLPGPSSEEISDVYGSSAERLARLDILLSKKTAMKYLADIGFTPNEKSFPQTTLSESNYKKEFDRKPAKSGKKLLFTYSEVRYLAGEKGSGSVPKSLEDLC